MPLRLTDTVRSFFQPSTQAFILANLELARTRIAPSSPDKAPEHLSRWHLNWEHSQLASRVLYDTQAPDPGQWLLLDIAVPLCPRDVLGNVPEEHRTFIVRDDTIWTLGELAVQDDELYSGLDITLTPEAFARIRAKREQAKRQNAAEGDARRP